MAIAGPYNRVTISGDLPGGEVWSTSCNYASITGGGSGGQGGVSVLQSWSDAIAAFFDPTLPNWIDQSFGGFTSITRVRCEFRDIDDGLIEAAETSIDGPFPAQPSTKPNQVAVVSTLMTERAGRSYKGRMYWPALGAGMVAGTGRLDASIRDLIASGVASLLSDIADENPGAAVLVPVVLSRTKREVTPVTAVRVGDVLDTQRRRRDELIENYFSVAL